MKEPAQNDNRRVYKSYEEVSARFFQTGNEHRREEFEKPSGSFAKRLAKLLVKEGSATKDE